MAGEGKILKSYTKKYRPTIGVCIFMVLHFVTTENYDDDDNDVNMRLK